ncbi:MAG: class I SAM-dependent methyltransferase [Patescibacteria group bacterium]
MTNKKTQIYSDGPVEDELLSLFKQPNQSNKIQEIIEHNPVWALRYHLSPVRHHLLSWYDFTPGKKLLEIGAGCGALTGLFLDKKLAVTAVELSSRRAEIIKNRFPNESNLSIISDNFISSKLPDTYDYITAIGVLEYSGKYIDSQNSYLDFLLAAKKHLNPGGTFILAIENKFGLKYWSGCAEDHTGHFFESIEGYPYQKDIITFSKMELNNLFTQAGFSHLEYYYPLPDYKLPEEIFSDQYLPSANHLPKSNLYPTPDFARTREVLFNEKTVQHNLIDNAQFPFFANSYLIFAQI